MKKIYLILCLWQGLLSLAAQNAIIYVHAAATGGGNGQNWTNAYTDLRPALQQAQAGDQIWVAEGVYRPTGDTARDSSFHLKSGVALYGGFAGTETALAQRDWQKNLSVLSGDLGIPGDSSDNAYTILYMENPDSSTVVDGFVLREGCANYGGGDLSASHPRRSGGAMYIMAAGGEAYAEVRNCLFERNRARNSGGAVYVNGTNEGSVAPRFWHCVFRGNIARDGGAVRRDGGSAVERPLDFAWCNFESNVSQNYGGGLYYNESEQQDSLQVYGCQLVNNFAKNLGGGIFLTLGRETGSTVNIRKCQFERNHATIKGTALYNTTFNLEPVKKFEIDSCLFLSNGTLPTVKTVVNSDGYGLPDSSSVFIVSNSKFMSNKGSGILCELIRGNGIIHGCEFINNDIYTLIQLSVVKAKIKNSIQFNTISNLASGIGFGQVHAEIENVVFYNKLSNFSAFYLYPASLTITNSTFAVSSLINLPSSPSVNWIERKIIIQNSALSVQKLVSESIQTEAKKEHKIFINNSYMPLNFCGDLPQYPTVTCDSGNYVGVGPLFVAPQLGDYRLHPCSPLVNAGSNAHILASNTLDVTGQPRIQDGRVDIGAYETAAPVLTGTPVVLAACAGQANGSIGIASATSGGCQPFKYQWVSSTGSMGTANSGLSAGTYTFTVSDQRGSTFSFSITMPDTLSILNAVVTQASDSAQADGSISVTAQGGTLPYQAQWSNGQTGLQLTDLPPGTYTLTLSDGNNCALTATYIVGVISSTDDPASEPHAQVLPNPATDALTVRLPSLEGSEKLLRFVLTDALGRTLREVDISDFDTTVDVSGLAAGLYFWQLRVGSPYMGAGRAEVLQAGRVVKLR